MKISIDGLKIIKEFEGLELEAYLDPVGFLTVGWGHLVKRHDGIKLGQKISLETATKLLTEDVVWAENIVLRFVNHKLKQNQFDAIVSFVFNVGQETFRRSSVLKFLNQRNYPEAMRFLRKYVYAEGVKLRGLDRRRKAEEKLFKSRTGA